MGAAGTPPRKWGIVECSLLGLASETASSASWSAMATVRSTVACKRRPPWILRAHHKMQGARRISRGGDRSLLIGHGNLYAAADVSEDSWTSRPGRAPVFWYIDRTGGAVLRGQRWVWNW